MPILLDRIEEFGINCMIWVGRVTRAEALAMPGRIEPAKPQFGRLWISYFDARADLSDLDATTLVQLRERLRPVVHGLAAKGEFRMILASNSMFNDPLLDVWKTMVATETDYPSSPIQVRSLDAAAQALGLSPADAARACRWIETQIDRL